MIKNSDPTAPDPRNRKSWDQGMEKAIADYLDRVNAGESIDPALVLAEHPDRGQEILEALEDFVDLGADAQAPRDLGVLGDYRLIRKIGQGGMGVVYEAWQNSLDRRVALKVLPRGMASGGKATTRFIREAQLAGRLNHTNVVPVYGMGIEGGTPYYAMEFVEGKTLSQILSRVRRKDAEPSGKTWRDFLLSVTPLFSGSDADESGDSDTGSKRDESGSG